jgi:uncharacterized protein (TIGR03437 family)
LTVDAAGNVYAADSASPGPPSSPPFRPFSVVRLLEPDGPAPTITAITNAASNLQGSIAPGEIVVLYHSGIGPAQLTQFHLNAGLPDTQLDRTQVTFNGTPAPLVYTWTSSLAAIVPYEVSGTNAQVQLTFRGQTSAPFTAQAAPSSPGLFTVDMSGKGQALALIEPPNRPPFFNSAQNPARIGDTIVLYATGEGRAPVSGVALTIGGLPAQLYGYSENSDRVGVMSVLATIPGGITPGNAVPVIVQVASTSSQSGVTIAVAGN